MGRGLGRSGPASGGKGSLGQTSSTRSSCVLKASCEEDFTTALQRLYQFVLAVKNIIYVEINLKECFRSSEQLMFFSAGKRQGTLKASVLLQGQA